MKIFLTIFAVIILAVISGGLYGKLRIDHWENAKDACYEQIQSEATAFRQAVRTNSDTADWNEARNRQMQAYRLLLQLLQNKPFGIPLDEEEQADLDGIRIELSRGENQAHL